jgi:SAM-dependent methyltransferase
MEEVEVSQHVTVVLPTYQEAGAIAGVMRDLVRAAQLLETSGCKLDVVLVDDNSPDGTAGIAQSTASEFGLPLTVLSGLKTGLGVAFLRGFAHVLENSSADTVVTMDGDGQHDAADIPRLVAALDEQDVDMVIGSRYVAGSSTSGMTPRRLAASKAANAAFRALTRSGPVRDATTTFRAVRREVLESFNPAGLTVSGYSLQTTLVALSASAGWRIAEQPINFRVRSGGESKMNAAAVAEGAISLLQLSKLASERRRRRLSAAGRSFDAAHFGAASDLERLGTADQFFDWILEQFDGHVGRRVLEVGAGAGATTRRLVERYPDAQVTAIEPADNLYPVLEAYGAVTPRLATAQGTLKEIGRTLDETFDTVVYLNVLEHVPDDVIELALARQQMAPGGHLLVFVPALEGLYSELDYAAGHYRRYSRDGLAMVAEEAGFQVVSCVYFDMLGVPPYYLVYKLLRRTGISGSSMMGYDRVIVPVSRLLQKRLPVPFGKNVVLVARA